MELYFLRHGLAGEPSQWNGDDDDRPLTEEGRARTAREGAGFARLKLVPDLILTSPLVRASQTAEIVARELGIAEQVLTDKRLSPGFGRKRLRKILKDHADQGRLMLVGHEPDFSETIGRLIGGGRVTIEKGGLASVEIPDPQTLRGKLLLMATPDLVESAAGSERI